MALLPIPAAQTSAGSYKKTIAISCSAQNTTYYTVPAGAVFEGQLMPAAGRYMQIRINGVGLSRLDRGADNKQFYFPITLEAGDVVATDGSYAEWSILGTETKA